MTSATALGGQTTRVTLFRTAGLVAIAGGLLRAAGSFAPVAVTSDLARESLYLVIDVCLAVGIVGFYSQRSKRIGWSGAAGLALALVGIATVRANRAIPTVDLYPAAALAIACGVIVVSTSAWVAGTIPGWVPVAFVVSTFVGIIGSVVEDANAFFVWSGVIFGIALRTAIPAGEEEAVKRLQLLTSKPVLYVCNVEEASAATGNAFSDRVRALGAPTIVVSAAIEAEVSQLPEADRREFLDTLGLSQSGLDQVIRAGYDLLELVTYFTCGPKETRAWTITKGTRAPQAAAVIHKDFERGFIACETIAYADFVAYHGEQGAKEAGRMRVEGKIYVVKDGDVLLFRFNV